MARTLCPHCEEPVGQPDLEVREEARLTTVVEETEDDST